MKEVKALFVDCDGVLYDRKECTEQDIVDLGLNKTLRQYHIPPEEFKQVRSELKTQKIRGIFNAVLLLCQKYNINFNEFALNMVGNINYSKISADPDILNLLQKVKLPVCVVTNNTVAHLNEVFACLHGGIPFDAQKELNLKFIPIESTLKNGIFHSKKMKNTLTDLCTQIGLKPEEVLLLDDSASVCEEAIEQGLQVHQIESPKDTKKVLKEFAA